MSFWNSEAGITLKKHGIDEDVKLLEVWPDKGNLRKACGEMEDEDKETMLKHYKGIGGTQFSMPGMTPDMKAFVAGARGGGGKRRRRKSRKRTKRRTRSTKSRKTKKRRSRQ